MSNYFSRKISSFHGRETPEEGFLAGHAMLIELLEKEYGKTVPLPDQLAIVTGKHQRYNTDLWQVFTTRHKPNDNIAGHLAFALKYEGIELYILKVLFLQIGEGPVLHMVNKEPTSQYARRVWFLYEWLLDKRLDLPDLKTGSYVELVNPKLQYPGPPRNSTRHRIKNNLPGNFEFCPLIRRTVKLERYITMDLHQKLTVGLSTLDKELVRRTAAFLMLKDSKASFEIEGEIPPNIRARNWGKAIGQAGKKPLTIREIERLQHLVIGSRQLKDMGLRTGEGFIGEHDRKTFLPIPDHISARAKDLSSLLRGLIETNKQLQKSNFDPVLASAIIAFGFVFIHPLSDGNGRIHRYLIHHILAEMGFAGREMIFPVSAAILDRIADYQNILESFSGPRLELIEWKTTSDHNIEIQNETADLYRYFDLTRQAEFLYECIEDTIDRIIPEEIDYLQKYDRMIQFINHYATLPDTKADLLIKFLLQNKGILPKRKREKEFAELTIEVIYIIEQAYTKIFVEV
ncbi:MAG TPA: cell filamentation protein Fic [Bacteroides sp.]|nr:cell filamentation protein Fic [Bacteroides sp.]